MPPEKWPSPKRLEKMPANASIALARLKKARQMDGVRDTELILDRTEGAVTAEPSVPMLQAIAAAIIALKAAGVDVKRASLAAEAVETVMQLPAPTTETPIEVVVEEDEDEDVRAKRLRRGRA